MKSSWHRISRGIALLSAASIFGGAVLAQSAGTGSTPSKTAKATPSSMARVPDDQASWVFCSITMGHRTAEGEAARRASSRHDSELAYAITELYWPEKPKRVDELPQNWAAIWKAFVATQVTGLKLEGRNEYYFGSYRESCTVRAPDNDVRSSPKEHIAERLEYFKRPMDDRFRKYFSATRKVLDDSWLRTPVTERAILESQAGLACMVGTYYEKEYVLRDPGETNVYEAYYYARRLRAAINATVAGNAKNTASCSEYLGIELDKTARARAQEMLEYWTRESGRQRYPGKVIDVKIPANDGPALTPKEAQRAEAERSKAEAEAKRKEEAERAKAEREQAQAEARRQKQEQAERAKREQEQKAFKARTEWAQARMDESVKSQLNQALREVGVSTPIAQPTGACKWIPSRQAVFRGADTEAEAREGLNGRGPNCLGSGKASLDEVTCTQIKGFHPVDSKGKIDWNTPAKVRYDCQAVYTCEQGKLDCGPAKPAGASRQ